MRGAIQLSRFRSPASNECADEGVQRLNGVAQLELAATASPTSTGSSAPGRALGASRLQEACFVAVAFGSSWQLGLARETPSRDEHGVRLSGIAGRDARGSVWRRGKVKKPAKRSGLAERLADARRNTWTAVRKHEGSKDRCTMPRDERTEASIEKGLADRLNLGEVKTHAAGGFQRLGNLVVDLLRVDSRPHPRAIVAHPNDRHRRATHCSVPLVASPWPLPLGRVLFPLPLNGRLS